MMHEALTQLMHELMHLIVQFSHNFEKLTQKIKFYEKFPILEEQKP